MGIKGILVGTLISVLVRRPLSIWYSAKITGLSLWRYIHEAFLPGFAFWLAATMLGFYALQGRLIARLGEFVVFLILYGLFSLILLILIERELIYRVYRKILNQGVSV